MTSETVEAVEIALGRFAVARAEPRRLLLAVSGGPDSLALLLAVSQSAAAREVFVATVDHGLRPESAGEAAYVADVCREFRVPHRILRWGEAASLRGNLLAAAREARYRLLADEAARVGADALLVAHHADDQLETHLIAKARGAGGPGLAGMRPWRDLEPGLALVRPFLHLPKRALTAAVERAGLPAICDPTNADPRYERARLRAALADGAHDHATLRRAIEAAAAQRAQEDEAVEAAVRSACEEGRLGVDDAGVATFDPLSGAALLWSRLLTAVGGGAHPPEGAAVERLAAAVVGRGAGTATLGGCRVEAGEGGVVLTREYGRAGPPALDDLSTERLSFDRRFTISLPLPEGAARIEPLGRLGLGGAVQRTLPVCLDRAGRLLAAHPALAKRLPAAEMLQVRQRVGWRIWADLPGDPPDRLTGEPQNAANGLKAVGKDLAATYLRGRVKVRAP